jgi:quercetin 2,3-dioxygenase
MSGPVRDVDLEGPSDATTASDALHRIELREGRRADVGGLDVVRVLPTKGRRTVGAWCFVDLLGPVDLSDPDPLEIGPHPHIGLSTVTWLLEGEALHTDSLGTEQVIRAGQLNLMTAGRGISHAELAAHPPFRGAQLWIAQPEETRHGDPAFEHHAQLPGVELSGSGGTSTGTLLVGTLGGATSPARADTPLVGMDLLLAPGLTVVPLDTRFEHAAAPLDVPVKVGEHVVEPGWLALVPPGVDELPLEVRGAGRPGASGGRVLLLGGEPLDTPIMMWWNFVARDRDEIADAWRSWNARDERFGHVASPLARIDAPAPPWLRA